MSHTQASQALKATRAGNPGDLPRGIALFWRSFAFLVAATAILAVASIINLNLYLIAVPVLMVVFVLLERAYYKTRTH
jgi:anti-sigma-K factor RskA